MKYREGKLVYWYDVWTKSAGIGIILHIGTDKPWLEQWADILTTNDKSLDIKKFPIGWLNEIEKFNSLQKFKEEFKIQFKI